MILKDLTSEYVAVKDALEIADKFYKTAVQITDFYLSEFSEIARVYYASPSSNSSKDQLVNNLSKLFDTLYKNVIKLNSLTRNLYKCLNLLNSYTYKNYALQEEVDLLTACADSSIDDIYRIIESQLPESRRLGLWHSLIVNLQNFEHRFNNILLLEKHFSDSEDLLYEPLPEHVRQNEDYTEFSINSLIISDNFESLSSSISAFGEIYAGISHLLELPTSDRCYIRKVETGSLVIVITGTTASLFALGKFIDFCVKKYIEYRKAGLEIKSMRQQIATTDLAMAEKVLELNPTLENKAELLAKASESAFKYFKLNPKFKIGDTLYDTGETTPLITDSNSDTTSNNLNNE